MADRPSASDRDGELVGIKSDDSIDVVAGKVSVALGLTLAPHDSSYWGDPYFSGWPTSDVKLTANCDLMFHDGDPAEERWFSFDGRDCEYVLWDVPLAESLFAALRNVGLDARPVRRS